MSGPSPLRFSIIPQGQTHPAGSLPLLQVGVLSTGGPSSEDSLTLHTPFSLPTWSDDPVNKTIMSEVTVPAAFVPEAEGDSIEDDLESEMRAADDAADELLNAFRNLIIPLQPAKGQPLAIDVRADTGYLFDMDTYTTFAITEPVLNLKLFDIQAIVDRYTRSRVGKRVTLKPIGLGVAHLGNLGNLKIDAHPCVRINADKITMQLHLPSVDVGSGLKAKMAAGHYYLLTSLMRKFFGKHSLDFRSWMALAYSWVAHAAGVGTHRELDLKSTAGHDAAARAMLSYGMGSYSRATFPWLRPPRNEGGDEADFYARSLAMNFMRGLIIDRMGGCPTVKMSILNTAPNQAGAGPRAKVVIKAPLIVGDDTSPPFNWIPAKLANLGEDEFFLPDMLRDGKKSVTNWGYNTTRVVRASKAHADVEDKKTKLDASPGSVTITWLTMKPDGFSGRVMTPEGVPVIMIAHPTDVLESGSNAMDGRAVMSLFVGPMNNFGSGAAVRLPEGGAGGGSRDLNLVMLRMSAPAQAAVVKPNGVAPTAPPEGPDGKPLPADALGGLPGSAAASAAGQPTGVAPKK